MGRCACGNNLICLSPMEGNQVSYDPNNCLYVPPDPAPVFGSINLPSEVSLVSPASGAWTDTGMTVSIPAGGTYEVTSDAFVALHVNVAADGGTGLIRVFYRLYNNTAGAVVPGTEVLALAAGSNRGGRYANAGGSSVHAYISPTVPTSIKAQVQRMDASSGAAVVTPVAISALLVPGTSLRYNRLT